MGMDCGRQHWCNRASNHPGPCSMHRDVELKPAPSLTGEMLAEWRRRYSPKSDCESHNICLLIAEVDRLTREVAELREQLRLTMIDAANLEAESNDVRSRTFEEAVSTIDTMHADSLQDGEDDSYLEGLVHAVEAIRALATPTGEETTNG